MTGMLVDQNKKIKIRPFHSAIVETLEFLDEFFEGFIRDNPSYKPLAKRTKNTETSGTAFINAAKEGLGKVLGDENTALLK
ncbi:hypothetical protein ACHAQD_002118 [Fusarium lateritium]